MEKINGIEKLQEMGIEILPEFKEGRPTLLLKRERMEKRIDCIHTVIYQGNVENMPEKLSAEVVQNKASLPDEETRKWAFYSFCEAFCENFPESLKPEMIGVNLSRRIKKGLGELGIGEYLDDSLEGLLERTEASYEEFKNSYFWSPPHHASGRRAYEASHSWNSSMRIEHQTARAHRIFDIFVDFNVSCSCRNIYVNKTIKINNQKINLTKFRGFCKKIAEGKSIPESYVLRWSLSLVREVS